MQPVRNLASSPQIEPSRAGDRRRHLRPRRWAAPNSVASASPSSGSSAAASASASTAISIGRRGPISAYIARGKGRWSHRRPPRRRRRFWHGSHKPEPSPLFHCRRLAALERCRTGPIRSSAHALFFTIETTYHLPIYRHRAYQADTSRKPAASRSRTRIGASNGATTTAPAKPMSRGAWRGIDMAYRGHALACSLPVRRRHSAQGGPLRHLACPSEAMRRPGRRTRAGRHRQGGSHHRRPARPRLTAGPHHCGGRLCPPRASPNRAPISRTKAEEETAGFRARTGAARQSALTPPSQRKGTAAPVRRRRVTRCTHQRAERRDRLAVRRRVRCGEGPP